MGSNNNRIRFDIDFNYNKSVINEALKSLDQLKRMTTGDLLQIKPEMDLTEATIKIESLKSDCQQLQSILTAAFNPKIGAVNIESFNSLIKQSYGSVSKLYNKFSEFGAAGKNAFLDMESAVLSSNTKLVKTQSLIDKIGVTLGNTIKWNISSSTINGIINKTREAYGYVKALDGSLNDIQIVTQKSADEMDRFARKANDAASALGRTTTDYTDAALTFYQQGLSDEEVQARTDLTLKVANTSGLNADDAAEYVTAVLNGYKVGSEEAEKAMDVLANVGAHTASSLSELSEAMSKVSSTANTMGVSEEQLAASLATVIQVTRQDASQVGTAFKTIYMRISDIAAGTEDAEVSLGNYTSEMAQLGYNVLDSSGQLRDLGEVIEEIGGNWQNMSREQQIALARTMAGTRQANNLLALFDNWSTYSDAIQYASDATGTLQQQQDTYMESTAAHLRDMSASYEDLFDSILDADTIDAFAVGLSKIGKFLANFVDAIGGGKGLLLSLGSIGLRVFNDQIGKSLAQLGKKTQAQIELQEHYNEIVATSGQFSEEEFGDSGVKELAETYKTIASIKNKISEEDARQLEQYAQQLQYQLKQRNTLIEQRDILKQSMNEQASSESSQILKTIKSDSTFGGIDKSNINSVESFNTVIDSINQNLIKTSRSINSLKGKITSAFKNNDIVKAEAGFNKLSNSVQGLIQKFGIADIEDEDLKASLKDLALKQEEANNAFVSGDIDLAKEKTKEYNNAINALVNKYKEYLLKAKEGANQGLFKNEDIEKAEKLEKLLKSLGINVDEIKGAIGEVADNANKADSIGNIVEGIGAIGQIVSAVSALKNIYSITTDEDLSSSEKFLQVAQSLTMIVPMIITSVKKLGESFAIETIQAGIASQGLNGMEAAQYALNTAMKSNPVLFFITALTTLIGVISAVAEIYDRTHMSVKEANEALDKYNGKVSELNSTRSNNKQQIEELEELRDRYDELSKIAGPYDENIELLDEESAKEYLSIKEKIAGLNEDSIAYYNSEGEVILKNNDSLDDTIEKLKEKNELEAKSLYNSKEQKEADEANYTLAKDASEKLKIANEELEAYEQSEDGTSKDGTSRKEIINNTLQDWLSRVQLQLSDKNLQLLTNEKMEGTDKTLYEVLSSGDFEDIETYQKEIRSQIKKISDEEEKLGRYGSVNTLSLWAEQYEDLVIGVGEKLQSAQKEAQEAVDNLSPLDVNEYLNKMQFNYDYSSTWNATLSEFEKNFGEEGYDFMTKIVSSFISGMSRFNEDGAPKTEEEIMAEIDRFTELIRNLTPENKDELDAIYNEYNNLDNYKNAEDRTGKIIARLNRLKRSKAFEGYTQDQFAAIIKSTFGFSDINFNDNGIIESYTDQYTDGINQALTKIETDYGVLLDRDTFKNNVFARGLEDSLNKIPEAYSHVADNVTSSYGKLRAALDYVEWTNDISSASNLLELQSAFNNIPKNIETSYNEYANKLIDLAKAYENCTGEVEKYNKALRTGIEIESAQAKLESSLIIGEASEKYDLEADNLETQAELLAQEYGITDQQAARLAVTNTRLNRGVSDLSSNWEKWSKILSSGSKTNSEYAETITDLRSAVADLLGVAEDTDIPLEFLQGHLKEIEKAAKGDIKSINKLGADLAKNTIENIDISDAAAWAVRDEEGNLLNESPWETSNFIEAKSTILEGIDQIHNKISELGDAAEGMNLADIMGENTARAWVTQLNEMAQATQMSVADMNNLLSELNLDAEVSILNQQVDTQIPRYKIVSKITGYENGLPTIESEVTQMEPEIVPGNISVAQINTGDDKGSFPTVISSDRGGVSKPSNNTTSSSSGTKTPNKAYTSKKDPYHDINIRIEKLSNSYSKLQKSQEKLTGDQLTKNLDKQLSILNQQVSAYEEKLDIAKKVAEEQKQELINSLNSSSLGIRISADDFTADGNLAEGVYEKIVSQYEAMIKKYDNRVLSDAEQETYDKLTEEYDNWLSKLSNYEETINSTMTEISDNLSDITDSLVDINLLKLKVQLDINLNVQEAIEQFKEFENRIIKGLKSDSIEYQINMAMTDITKVFDSKVLEEQMNVVNKVRQAYEQELAGVRSELFMGDLSKATETLEENLNNLKDIIIGLADSWDSLEEVGVSAIGAIADAFENKSSTLQFFESQIDHDLALIEKTYGETAYDKMVDFYNKKQVLIESQLVNAQTQVDVLYAEMISAAQKYGTDSDIYKEIVSRWESACQSLNSVFEASAENLQNIYQNAINNISSSFVKSITGGFSTETIDYTLSLLDKQMSSVLDNIQADLAIQKFENTWAKAINNSSSDKYKKNLESIVKTQLDGLQVLAEENLLSQNRVDLAEKYLQWQQAIMDLEETRNNKTTMRLRRDASGNYSYQYVASTNDILDAQQAALEKQDDYYNALLNNIKGVFDNINSELNNSTVSFAESLDKIQSDSNLSDTQKQKAIEELISNYESVFGSIINSQLTADAKSLLQQYLELTGNDQIDSIGSKFFSSSILSELMNGDYNVRDLANQFLSAISDKNIKLEDLYAGSTEESDKIFSTLDDLISSNDEMINSAVSDLDYFKETYSTLQEWYQLYKSLYNDSVNSTLLGYNSYIGQNSSSMKGTSSLTNIGNYSNLVNSAIQNGLNATNAILSNLSTSNLGSSISSLDREGIDQIVNISATFTDATTANEITAALSNLVNTATQYAYTKKN